MNAQRNQRYLSTVPPEEILPIVDSNFESSVKGIHVIGDATGVPLVKIAANQGREVIEKISSQSSSIPDSDSDHLDLVIIGAGPAGLSAALEAHKRGWKYVVLEKSKVANTVRGFPAGKKVYAEPYSVAVTNDLGAEGDLEKDEFLSLVDELVKSNQLHLKEDTAVERIRKTQDGTFRVETSNGKSFPAARVIIAIGRQGRPRKLDVPGEEDSSHVSYRFFTANDYQRKKILVVGGGNSAIETALMLMENNEVSISYRGDQFFRAKNENKTRLQQAIDSGRLTVHWNSQVKSLNQGTIELDSNGTIESIEVDQVIVQIGTLPPIDFLLDTGIELDGIWNQKRFFWAAVGLAIGVFIYFFAKHFVLIPERAGEGRIYVPGLLQLSGILNACQKAIGYLLPIPWLALLALTLINKSLQLKRKKPVYEWPAAKVWLVLIALVYVLNGLAPHVVTLEKELAGPGPYYLPGLSWIFQLIPEYFSGLNGFYYLLYFTAILFFGIYWAARINHRLVWKRNLTIIAVQWTLWWGIPTFLVVFAGTNPWTPFLSRTLNAWPLKMDAFQIDPSIVRPGDPEWWYVVGVVSIVWAVFLTFVVIPIFTIKFGKIYCSYVCSCGALAETVGHSFRHRGPKGDTPRKLEKFGFVIVALAALATCAHLSGWTSAFNLYNVWVGTFLAGAISIGLYPFLGQRLWCRMWCPLAFWMNFWGRWSKFKISSEEGKCIDCNMCNQYCQMGIDIKSRALQGKPVTLQDTPCIGCAECVIRCPMEILHVGPIPEQKLHQIGSDSSKQICDENK